MSKDLFDFNNNLKKTCQVNDGKDGDDDQRLTFITDLNWFDIAPHLVRRWIGLQAHPCHPHFGYFWGKRFY